MPRAEHFDDARIFAARNGRQRRLELVFASGSQDIDVGNPRRLDRNPHFAGAGRTGIVLDQAVAFRGTERFADDRKRHRQPLACG